MPLPLEGPLAGADVQWDLAAPPLAGQASGGMQESLMSVHEAAALPAAQARTRASTGQMPSSPPPCLTRSTPPALAFPGRARAADALAGRRALQQAPPTGLHAHAFPLAAATPPLLAHRCSSRRASRLDCGGGCGSKGRGSDAQDSPSTRRDVYKLGQVVGEGGFGVVRLCTSKASGNKLAVKIIKKAWTSRDLRRRAPRHPTRVAPPHGPGRRRQPPPLPCAAGDNRRGRNHTQE